MARSIYYYTDSDTLGGAEESLFMLIESLDRELWSPTLLLARGAGEPLTQRAQALEIPVKTIDPMPLGLTGARQVPELVRMLRDERPDVFHAALTWALGAKWALTAAVLARVPATVATVQLVGPFEIDRSNQLQLRALAAGVGRYIAVSQDIERRLIELGVPAHKIDVVYNAARTTTAAVPEAARLRARKLLGPARHIAVLTVARLDQQKGHNVLLEAAAELPGMLLAFAGEGGERERLMAQAAALGVSERVLFLGHRADVPELLAACDVFALPSLYEGSSLAILEAMVAGLPIVSSAVPGTDELLVDGETALLVPPGDPIALRGALRRLFADPALRRSLGARARARSTQFTPEAMTEGVTRVYRELLGDAGEGERNRLLRLADWRFLLSGSERPQALNLAGGELAAATELIADVSEAPTDLVVASGPGPEQFRQAASALRPGGSLYAEWTTLSPGRALKVRRELARTGFERIRFYWPGPRADRRQPEFWLGLDSPDAIEHLLRTRPPQTPRDRVLRAAWRLGARTGSLAPLAVIAEMPGGANEPAPELLLTGGGAGISKVVGLGFGRVDEEVVKFARVPEAEVALAREAEVLRALEAADPDLTGVPRIHSELRRVGMAALAESAIHGTPLMSELTEATFSRLARDVTDWLIRLAGTGLPVPRAAWTERLVLGPFEQLEQGFGAGMVEGELDAIRTAVGQIPHLPHVFEHRDCSPWNVIITPDGRPALLDWESAEPRGLPLLDLVYFLANSAFVLEDALETGRTREAYARMLDPSSPTGRVAADCIAVYCEALGIGASAVAPLRLLTWIVHTHSEFLARDRVAVAAPSTAALGSSVFLGLIREELR